LEKFQNAGQGLTLLPHSDAHEPGWFQLSGKEACSWQCVIVTWQCVLATFWVLNFWNVVPYATLAENCPNFQKYLEGQTK